MQTSLQSEKPDVKTLIKSQSRVDQITFFKCEPTVADPVQKFCSYQEHKFFTLEAAEGFQLIMLGDYPVMNLHIKRYLCVEDTSKKNCQPLKYLVIDSINVVNGGTKSIIESVKECTAEDIPDIIWQQLENSNKLHVIVSRYIKDIWEFSQTEPQILLITLLMLTLILLTLPFLLIRSVGK